MRPPRVYITNIKYISELISMLSGELYLYRSDKLYKHVTIPCLYVPIVWGEKLFFLRYDPLFNDTINFI